MLLAFARNSCLQRWIIEVATPNFVRTSSMVVSRCRLSRTTFNLNSAVYCFRVFAIASNTFLFRSLPCSLVHYTRYWTGVDLSNDPNLQTVTNVGSQTTTENVDIQPAPVRHGGIYVVRTHDSLSSIAHKLLVTPDH